MTKARSPEMVTAFCLRRAEATSDNRGANYDPNFVQFLANVVKLQRDAYRFPRTFLDA